MKNSSRRSLVSLLLMTACVATLSGAILLASISATPIIPALASAPVGSTPSVPSFIKCGVERWAVKTASDPDAHFLFDANGHFKKPKKLKIADMILWAYPFLLNGHASLPKSFYNKRVHPYEELIVTVEATLIKYKQEKGATGDNDYHLVLEDEEGNTMIVEIPHPDCVATTNPRLHGAIERTRAAFDQKFSVSGSFQTTDTKVSISGVPFFDRPHANGAADNGIEIHPVLDIQFK